MIPKKQIEKLAREKFGSVEIGEHALISGWIMTVSHPQEHFHLLEAVAPSRAGARAGINAMLFALPKRRRVAK